MLAEFLTSNTRADLLRILFDGRNNEHYLRDIEKLSSVNIQSIQKEVKHLTSLDLIKSRKDGNRIYYSANVTHPLYPDLVSIVEKTVGIVAQLIERLDDKRIEAAFLFGSFANGKEKSESDIDLIVIGELGMRALTKLISGIQEKIGREINPHIFTKEEFKKRIKEKDHFVTSILKEEIKFIKGDLDEYR
jgi:predicted nucleotidyltransferase